MKFILFFGNDIPSTDEFLVGTRIQIGDLAKNTVRCHDSLEEWLSEVTHLYVKVKMNFRHLFTLFDIKFWQETDPYECFMLDSIEMSTLCQEI